MPSLHPNRSSSTHNDNENNRLPSSSTQQDVRPGLFERLKWQSSSKKRKNESTTSPETTSDYHSPFNLALRLRALLDSHPVNSPAPRFQPLPTPDQSPTLSHASPLPPVIPGSPLPIQNYDPLPFSPALSTQESHYLGSNASLPQTSSPTTYFSAQPGDEADLVALLSSPEFMNGSLPLLMPSTQPDPLQTPGILSPVPIIPGSPDPSAHILRSPGRRQSVFSILDRIGSPKARAKRLGRQAEEVPRGSSYLASLRGGLMSPDMSSISSVLASSSAQATYGSDATRDMDTEDESVEDGDDTNIMLYSPLMPTATSLVSIADSEMVPIVVVDEEEENDNDGGREERTADAAPPASEIQVHQQPETGKSGWSWSNVLSFSSWWSSSNEASSTSATASTQPASTSQVQQPEPQPTLARVRRRRVWVPSRTQLSLETTWWGYRIYIPPPVLETLDITSTETNRRAALLTAALTWFFTHFPVHVLPLTVRPVIIILQGLVPYLGYLGGLLSWSWGTIRTYDEGYGIILTATWLLPIALIPSTWVPPDWPGSPSSGTTVNPLSPGSQSTPVPLPLSSPLPAPQPLAQPHQFSPELQQVEHQQHFPVYSPYTHTSMLSPLPQHFGFFSVPAPNASPHEHYPTAASPVMAMSMMTPAVMYSPMMAPVLTPSPSSPGSHLSTTASPSASPAMYTASSPVASSSAMETATATATATRKRRSKTGDSRRRTKGSLNAPRMSTVPLPGDEM
ncbi:hypothetical protein JOM56_001672 [Amanita muscaria]